MPLSDEQKAIIAKLEDGLDGPSFEDLQELAKGGLGSVKRVGGPVPLSIKERTLVAETLRRAWLTPEEWKAYRHRRELQLYEATKKIARYGVPYGQREQWVQRLYGKSREALKQFVTRRRP